MTADELTSQSAIALRQQFPRVNISGMSDCRAVAEAIMALSDAAMDEIQATRPELAENHLQRRQLRVTALANCLETWRDSGIEGTLRKCIAGLDRWIEFGALGEGCECRIRHGAFEVWIGTGDSFSEALGAACLELDSTAGVK